MIKGIIFDCFGVLYSDIKSALIEMCDPVDRQEMYDLSVRSDYGFVDSGDYLVEVSRLTGRPVGEIEQILQQKHVRRQELFDYLKSVDRTKYKLGLLSNVGPGVFDRLFTPGELDSLFDTVICSHQVHMLKPNPDVFTLAAERLGLATHECVMVDDLEDNCEGAEVAGMKAIWHASSADTLTQLANLKFNS